MTEVAYLRAECGVRYWEDGALNGVEDQAARMPFINGDTWCPTIHLATGTVEGWPEGISAATYYKVCDAGRYTLLNAAREPVTTLDGYVPKIMCPGGDGYGDYVIMRIGPDGKIADWRIDLEPFSEETDETFEVAQ